MWRTQIGDRVLHGAEWGLFRAGFEVAWELAESSLDDPAQPGYGIPVYDRLQPNQKLALLAMVGKGLSDVSVPCPVLTALLESAVAVVFEIIQGEVECEIDTAEVLGASEETTYWRRLVASANEQAAIRKVADIAPSDEDDSEEDEDWDLPTPDVESRDHEGWRSLIECLSNRILWEDGDYLVEEGFLDVHPQIGETKKALMDIPEDYYTAIAPDPTDEELGPIRAILRDLCGTPTS